MATTLEHASDSAFSGRLGGFVPVAAMLAAGMLVAFAIIPPWQNPDEPQHLLTVRLVMLHGPDFVLDRDTDPASERAIVASMAEHGWWGHYGAATPDPVPPTFADGPARVTQSYFGPPGGGSRLYYRAMATAFDWLSIDGLLPQLHAMRLVSALATLVALWFVWSGTRALLSDRAAQVVTAVMALHPQFAFVSTSASPDAVVNLAGAIVWRQSAIVLTTSRAGLDMAALWTAAVVGFSIRRMGAPLLVTAAVVTIAAIGGDFFRRRSLASVRPLVLAGAAVALVLTAVLGTEAGRAFAWVQFDPRQALAATVERADALPPFFDMFYRTFWLSAGWLRHAGPEWWHLGTVALVAIAAAGLVARVVSTPGDRALWLAAAVVAVQMAAVVAYYFGIVRSGPQGRYLFPVLPAIACLIWIGWNAAAGRIGAGRYAPAALVLAVACLNATAWLFVVLPAYL